MNILISGAGIAGLSTAYWLHRFGFKPTIIEAAPKLRNEGYMMDFFGSGYDVGVAMGLLPDLKKKDHAFKELIFLNENSKRRGGFRRSTMKKVLRGKYFTIMRGELEDMLYKKVKNKVPIRFGTSIKSLRQTKKDVSVTFEDGSKERFDLIIGADGIHSRVRKLAFGKEKRFSHYLGYYIAAFIIPNTTDWKNNFYSYTEVNRMAGAHLHDNKQKVATFMVFKSRNRGYVAPDKRLKILNEAFAGAKGFIPQLFEGCNKDHPVFFDAVTQIKMKTWNKDRVTLVGDAGACLTALAGQGATMAMAEAYILANELKEANGDHKKAFEKYETFLKPIVESKQKEAEDFASSFAPSTRLGMFFYNVIIQYIDKPWVLKWVFRSFELESIFDQQYPKPPPEKTAKKKNR